MIKVALYARYSSDNQRDASIEDQLRLCRLHAERQGWTIVDSYTDHAISGASLLRPGIQELIQDAHARPVRRSCWPRPWIGCRRDQEDIAGLFKRLGFAGVKIVTLSEGEVSELHVGLKGTMNALFLKDLADKTRRGLRGRVEARQVRRRHLLWLRRRQAVRGRWRADPRRPRDQRSRSRRRPSHLSRLRGRQFAQRIAYAEQGRHRRRRSAAPGASARSTATEARHRHPEQRALYRPAGLEPATLIKDPDTGKRVSRPNPRRVDRPGRARAAHHRDRTSGTRVKARQEAIRSNAVTRQAEPAARSAAAEVPVRGADQMRLLRRRLCHDLAGARGLRDRAEQRHLRQPAQHPAGRARERVLDGLKGT